MKHVLILAVAVTAFVVPTTTNSQEPKPAAWKVLDRFVGEWSAEVTNKPTKLLPDGGNQSVKQSISRILKDQFILGREVSSDGMKILWLMTYDPKRAVYPFWYFNNKGVFGGEWENTWDENSRILTGKATDTPKGWTSRSTNHFADKNSSQISAWMKDDSGTLLFDSVGKKTRQSEEAREKTLAEWSKQKPDKLPPELAILERLVGTWDAKAVSKPAEWTPKEVRTTSHITRKWVLDDRILQDTSKISDGSEGLSLLTYDTQMKAYRSWWFNSEGHTTKSTGQWDAASETMSFKSDLGNGLTSRASVRFIDKDRHDWKVVVKDGDDKLYFHGEWYVARRKK